MVSYRKAGKIKRLVIQPKLANPKMSIRALKRAKELLRGGEGWIKGALSNHSRVEPKYCMIGVIDEVTGFIQIADPWIGADLTPEERQALWEARRPLKELLADCVPDDAVERIYQPPGCGLPEEECTCHVQVEVPTFNDASGTTYDQVVAAFDCAIAYAEHQLPPEEQVQTQQ